MSNFAIQMSVIINFFDKNLNDKIITKKLGKRGGIGSHFDDVIPTENHIKTHSLGVFAR